MADRILEYINEFDRWRLDDLSKESVFEYFFFNEEKILSITDDAGKLSGIITLGSFINHLDDIRKAVNENYLFIRKSSQDHMFVQANQIFEKYGIESGIPVIDHEKKITGFIRDRRLLMERKTAYEKQMAKAVKKIKDLKRSHYLEKETEAFCDVLSDTKIYIRQCDACHDIFSIFDGKIQGVVLSDSDYVRKVRQMICGECCRTEEERTELIFDFEYGNRDVLIDRLGTVPVYSLKKFMSEFIALSENEEFSRIIRITRDSEYGLKDFIVDNGMENIRFSANRLLTKYVYDYMKKNQISFCLTDDEGFSVLHASFSVNGYRGSSQDVVGFSSCDLLELYDIDKKTLSRKINVFNIQSAVHARMTEGEKIRMEKYRVLETLIEKEDYENLQILYKDDCGGKKPLEYAKEILYSYPVRRRFENDLIVNVDYNSQYVNIENGIRKTCNQPEVYHNTIYFIGPCIALGPYVEDRHTIPSLLSKKLAEENYFYRVVNLGMLSANNISELLNQLSLEDGDIIINMIYIEETAKLKKRLGNIIDPSEFFDRIPDREDMFFDKSVHCNRKGNQVYADCIYQNMKSVLKKNTDLPLKKNQIYDVFKTNITDLYLYDFHEYLEMLEREKSNIPIEAEIIGSIVMNCNPFTLGHQYLTEYALRHCDYLFIFIVQEDKSYFSFKDRFAIAVDNCRKYKNVSVIPSGKMIASKSTFPEYFKREMVRDEVQSEVKITPVLDFRLFANYIAPILGIKKRFVAEEPLDPVTRQYNENMKKVLGAFDLEVVEIRRKTLEDGEIISASKVRSMYRSGNYRQMKKMLPECTYEYLVKK